MCERAVDRRVLPPSPRRRGPGRDPVGLAKQGALTQHIPYSGRDSRRRKARLTLLHDERVDDVKLSAELLASTGLELTVGHSIRLSLKPVISRPFKPAGRM